MSGEQPSRANTVSAVAAQGGATQPRLQAEGAAAQGGKGGAVPPEVAAFERYVLEEGGAPVHRKLHAICHRRHSYSYSHSCDSSWGTVPVAC